MPRSKKQGLSKRERQVLILAQGCSKKEICGRLQIAAGTEKSHRQRIFKKLGVTSIVAAIVRAVFLGWIPLVRPEDLDNVLKEDGRHPEP